MFFSVGLKLDFFLLLFDHHKCQCESFHQNIWMKSECLWLFICLFVCILTLLLLMQVGLLYILGPDAAMRPVSFAYSVNH